MERPELWVGGLKKKEKYPTLPLTKANLDEHDYYFSGEGYEKKEWIIRW